LVAWQKKHGYPVSFACEATLNIAKQSEILATMREARFDAVFIGIETPETETHLTDFVYPSNRGDVRQSAGDFRGCPTDAL
jgi:hypothetical protein